MTHKKIISFSFARDLAVMFAICVATSVVTFRSAQGQTSARVQSGAAKKSKAAKDFEKIGAVVYRTFPKLAKQNLADESLKSDSDLKCDVYVPAGEGPFPAIIAIHGGAWRQGTKFAMLRHAWRMAKSGYVVVAINYRHAPEHQFPAQVHDCKYAVRWMRANADKYKIDPDRIGAFGYSAGGHLAAMLGTSDSDDGLEMDEELSAEENLAGFSSRVSAVVSGGAPCEFGWVEEQSSTLVYWLGHKRGENPNIYRAASPTSYVTSDDPPFYFFHGETDLIVPVSTSQKLHDRLTEVGVSSKHDVAKNLGHIATFSDLTWMTRAIKFFDANLKNQ